ncbi:hypothetical protein [Pseudodesulfovibrio tunisiensis]|uniref:hypothetical protein n=1 Tax=Pseudodesulfovibrio tunisiensis TaxID=463192 RepID=UPI001FB2D660|nr:hypothetical protein [Pseudodesulfovibrio tunisiensis]
MSEQARKILEEQLEQCLGPEMPEHPTADIHVALRVAEIMEARGYAFKLKDLCPKSLTDSMWKASFSRNETEFASESSDAACALCAAAVAALQN